MSDPVNVVFHSPSRHEVGPMVYLHWGAPSLIEDLEAALPRMRTGDVSYACARFIGYCHTQIDGVTSLGVMNILFPGIQEGDTYEAVYQRIMSALAEDIARVDVDSWLVQWNGQRFEFSRQRAGRENGFPGPTGG